MIPCGKPPDKKQNFLLERREGSCALPAEGRNTSSTAQCFLLEGYEADPTFAS